MKQLEVFIEIAKEGSVSHAANRLFMTQSACSMALAALEEQLNPLFDRLNKQLILNQRGKRLLPKAINILSEVNELQNLTEEISGQLLIGASTTIGNYLLPAFISHFLTKYQQIKMTPFISNTEHIIQELLKFKIDLGLIEGNCHEPDLQIIPWKVDELIIIANKNSPLTKKRKLSFCDIENEKWILREVGSGTRQKFEEGIPKKITPYLELNSTEAIKQAVRAGMGISCISKTAAQDLLDQNQIIELIVSNIKIARNFYIVLNKKREQSALLKLLIQDLKR